MSLIEQRRALMMAQREQEEIVLPDGYTKLNYIEGTGTQWIDTKYNCADDYTPYRVKCKFKMTDVSSATPIFGSNRPNSGVSYILQLTTDIEQKKFVFTRLSTTGSGLRFSSLDAKIHEFEYVFKEGAYFDKVFIEGSETPASVIGAYSDRYMGLFTRINGYVGGKTGIAKCQMYGFELYGENNEPHRIFVPAQRKSDGKIGMYDIVTNTFLTNSGTGEFIGG